MNGWTRAALESGLLDLRDPEVRAMLRAEYGIRPTRRRSFPAARLRSAVGDAGVIEGLASAYGREYPIGAGVSERIEPGAFSDWIAARDGKTLLVLEHDWTQPLGTASVWESSAGLHFRATVFDTDKGRAVHRAASERALTGVSLAFIPEVIRRERNGALEVIERAEGPLEVSVVVRPANAGATITNTRSAA